MAEQILNAMYFNKDKMNNRDDAILLIKKDSKTLEKTFKLIKKPKINWYVTKEEHRDGQLVHFIDKSKVEMRQTEYNNILWEMADEIGNEAHDFLAKCINNRQFYQMKRLHLNPIFHGTDMNIEDFYISAMIEKNTEEVQASTPITKSYFDIEVDSDGYVGFPDEHEAPCPINAITLFLPDNNNTSFTYLLRNSENKQIKEFEDNVDTFINELHDEFMTTRNIDIDFKLKFYDEEIDLIQELFADIIKYKPDFVMAWNAKFDILTMINRIEYLGYNVEDIMCPTEIPYKKVKFHEDTRSSDFGDKSDRFEYSGYSIFVDQLLKFASLRRTAGKRESYALNDVAQQDLGWGKVEMGEGITISNFAWKDYRNFVYYNIVDVILLHFIEERNQDITQFFNLANITHTRFEKAFTKTTCLKNLARVYGQKNNLVLSNNHNQTYGGDREPSEKFKGALTLQAHVKPF